ncbi:hypothetical protein PIB30_028185 [Stylosanthes scabra]|uniref:DC1 domain-containing protein n=1 Tax=Stylosanthes scabra TaxID=79078 RepID=A0ABU6QAD2_9FABA|nr:hypothetical protein [Stylosanthes scabra]
MANAYVCDSCKEQGRFWAFYFDVCDYDLHPSCIQRLKLVENAIKVSLQADIWISCFCSEGISEVLTQGTCTKRSSFPISMLLKPVIQIKGTTLVRNGIRFIRLRMTLWPLDPSCGPSTQFGENSICYVGVYFVK